MIQTITLTLSCIGNFEENTDLSRNYLAVSITLRLPLYCSVDAEDRDHQHFAGQFLSHISQDYNQERPIFYPGAVNLMLSMPFYLLS